MSSSLQDKTRKKVKFYSEREINVAFFAMRHVQSIGKSLNKLNGHFNATSAEDGAKSYDMTHIWYDLPWTCLREVNSFEKFSDLFDK